MKQIVVRYNAHQLEHSSDATFQSYYCGAVYLLVLYGTIHPTRSHLNNRTAENGVTVPIKKESELWQSAETTAGFYPIRPLPRHSCILLSIFKFLAAVDIFQVILSVS